jgi:hypothetical protein
MPTYRVHAYAASLCETPETICECDRAGAEEQAIRRAAATGNLCKIIEMPGGKVVGVFGRKGGRVYASTGPRCRGQVRRYIA